MSTMTYKQAAQSALDVQDACNLSGVAKSLAGPVMDALWAEARLKGHGSDFINQHPIVTLYIDKLASLNRSQGADMIDKVLGSYDEVHKIVEGAA
jgi:hypothetical protein